MVTYCTVEDVASRLNLIDQEGGRLTFDTLPTQEEVEDMILVAETILDNEMNTAFGDRVKTITDELQDYWYNPIFLKFRNVVTPLLSGTDKLEVFDGNEWDEWVADATITEGRGDEFFIDGTQGIIYFLRKRPHAGKIRVRLTYRVRAQSTVPKDVAYACCLQTGIIMANSEFADILFPEGASEEQPLEVRMARWEDQIKQILKFHTVESRQQMTGMPFTPIGSHGSGFW